MLRVTTYRSQDCNLAVFTRIIQHYFNALTLAKALAKLSNIVVTIDTTLLDPTLFDCLSYPFIEQFLLNKM